MNPEMDAVLKGEQKWACIQGDALAVMQSMADDSVSFLMTSPPYERARLYLEDGSDLGIARDTEAWVSWMLSICHEARRICRGLCVFVVEGQTRQYRYSCSPFLLMADLHRAGFHLRKPPIYKRVGIPGSGGPDFLRNDWEPCLVFSKGGKLLWSDNSAMGHPPKWAPGGEMSHRVKDGHRRNKWGSAGGTGMRLANGERRSHFPHGHGGTPRKPDGSREPQPYEPPLLANPGNIIDCKAGGGHMGNDLAHENEAPYPESLVEFFIRSFAPPDGIVFDPFCGSGTTLSVAIQWGRRALGCDLRKSQVELTQRRCRGAQPPLFVEG